MFLFDNVTNIATIRKKQPRCNGCRLCSDWAGSQFGRYQIHAGYEWLLDMEVSQMTRFEDAIYEFASRVYRSRLWIVPELRLTQNAYLLCGDQSLIINDLRFAWYILWSLYDVSKDHSSLFPLVTLAKQKGKIFRERRVEVFELTCNMLGGGRENQSFDLEHEGYILRELGCANPLDRVYGLLELIQWPESCGPPTPDYSITLCELVIDVTNRLSRHWNFPSAPYGICFGLGLEKEFEKHGQPGMDLLLGRTEDLFKGDTTTPCQRKCSCCSSTAPRIAMTKNIWKYGVVYEGNEDNLFVTMYTRYTPNTHVELRFSYNEETNHYTDMLVPDSEDENEPCHFLFWSSVQIQAKDIIAEIDIQDDSDPRQPEDDKVLVSIPRFCVILRDAGCGYYKICGQA
jgi:hypothetical protein